jgi:YbbR domain-containing protein
MMARFLRWLVSNLATMTLAFLLAVIIWATAIRSADPLATELIQVAVQVVGKPADGLITSGVPENVQVAVNGPMSSLAELEDDDFGAVIDLSDVPFGEQEVPIQIAFEHDLAVITSQFPATALITMEQIVSRDVLVVVDVRGEVARGHSQEAPNAEPDVIRVTGPSSRVDQLAEARVTVLLDNTREEVNVARRPTFYDVQGNVASVTGLTLSDDEVEVIVPVSELAGFAEKPITAQWVGEPAAGYRLLGVSVEPDSVLVTGRPTQLEVLSRLETEPIDISGLTETFRDQVALALPEGVTLEESQPVFVTIEIEPISSTSIVRKTPEVRALTEGLTVTVTPEEVRVFLFGPLPVLDSLNEDDVRVTLDLLNLEVGTHRLEPIVVVSANNVELRSIQPQFLTVMITNVVTTTNELTETTTLTNLLSLSWQDEATAAQPVRWIAPMVWAKAAPDFSGPARREIVV